MRIKPLTIVLIFFTLIATKTAEAVTLYLVPDSTQCPAGSSIAAATCFTNLATAITTANTGVDSIEILPGTYTGNFTLNKNVPISGTETARVFLAGGGSGTALTVSGVTNPIRIKNITFTNATTGILVQSSSSVAISNNIFEITSGTGVQTSSSSATEIINNVFYKNATGIQSDAGSITITNNIFSSNTSVAISSNVPVASILNNLFFGNSSIGPTGIVFDSTDTVNWLGNVQNTDPKFVDVSQTDITKLDFHLQAGSPCINTGNAAGGANRAGDTTKTDMGAYGGSNSDTIPFPVSGLLVTGVTTTLPATASLTWNQNKCYAVGGYKVYYGTASGSANYGASPIDTLITTASFDLTGLVSVVTSGPTGTPAITDTIESRTINLNWSGSTITDATGYEIRYDTTSPVTAPTSTNPAPATTVIIDAGSATSYSIGNLVNGTRYYFLVTPYAQTIYYIAVKAYYSNDKTNMISSAFSNEEKATLSDKVYGASGNIDDYPEAISPYPDLPNNGCFIATAAYGYYSAPQVQALRLFRDRYLLTNAPGKAFVRWYYRYGPIGAAFMETHPWLKPLVRIALLPAVGSALFLTEASFSIKLFALMIVGSMVAVILYRKNFLRSGGLR